MKKCYAKSVLMNQFVSLIFCLCFVFTGIILRGMLHHVCDEAYDENVWTNQNSWMWEHKLIN